MQKGQDGEFKLISAKEALEVTSSRTDKVKEEKLALVDNTIRSAAENELFSTKLSFAQLRPFAGYVIEQLTELGYRVTQTGQFVFIEWSPVKAKFDAKVSTKPPLEGPVFEELESEDEQDDSDIWNT